MRLILAVLVSAIMVFAGLVVASFGTHERHASPAATQIENGRLANPAGTQIEHDVGRGCGGCL